MLRAIGEWLGVVAKRCGVCGQKGKSVLTPPIYTYLDFCVNEGCANYKECL